MTRRMLALALVVLVAGVCSARANSPEILRKWNSAQIEWLSFEDGAREARRSGKRMLVVFHTTWCPHCTRYRKQFFDRRVTALARKLVMVLVDRDADPATNARYGAFGRYIPRTMVLDSRARLVTGIRGPHADYPHYLDTYGPDDLIRMMTRAAAPGR